MAGVSRVLADGAVTTAKLAASARPGLVFVKSGTCSAQTSLSIDDCFSAAYNNYRIVISGLASVFTNLEVRLRVASTDATTAYASQLLQASGATVTASTNGGATSRALVGAMHTSQSLTVVDVSDPFLAQQTMFVGAGGAGAPRVDCCSAVHTTATSYTGISFFPDVSGARTFTTTARVYGYANS